MPGLEQVAIIIGFFLGLTWSYVMVSRVAPPRVMAYFKKCLGDPVWLEDTYSTMWETSAPVIGKGVLNAVQSQARAATTNLKLAAEDMAQGVEEDLPNIPLEDLAKYSAFARTVQKSSRVRDTLQMVQEYLPLLQQLGNIPNNGGGGNNVPSPQLPRGGNRGGWS